MQKTKHHLFFVLFTSLIFVAAYCIFLIAYFVFISSANIFDNYSITHNFKSTVFPSASIMGVRMTLFITILCTLKSFQNLNWQYFLMFTLIALLLAVFVMPISFHSYPLIAGLSNAIFDLTEPWRQLFAPPPIRATIEGITEGLTGIIDLTSIGVESGWSQHLSQYQYVFSISVALLLLGWIFTRKMESLKFSIQERNIVSTSILKLLKEYPYIFIACLFGGVNMAIFNYVFFLIKTFDPTLPAKHFQFFVYIGSIIGPIIIGRIGDKKGIFFTMLCAGLLLIIVKSIILAFIGAHYMFFGIHIFSLLLGGLSSSIWALTVAIVGERLRSQGIFRAFAISNIIFEIGFITASRVYEHFGDSFHPIRLLIVFIDSILLIILYSFYKKEKHLPPKLTS